ncbi:Pimeloyl-ACP methyl ester carboxylesterase [Paenibacillus sophorae]|uniref:Alpha/beta hydrolase n=1 Tax=Paenibacillus sophorae TaxID=1333845 RepID=A0A1H8FCZ6_9BACL|nr:alpha/beta hydrolase [Paenibacillus sophorae]QWU13835.1 alpha/beta hydrolase [Paenibacillus sophorae]SEN29466.1 Pimeloyl-ACP methyl ester carboxylesterase [Paenibacillus sophorae]
MRSDNQWQAYEENQQLTAETVETSFVEAGGVTFAFRTFGAKSVVPLVMVQRFRGTLDDWDPALINRLAQDRTIIMFDNAGVGLSSGEAPDTIEGMAEYAIAFIEALGLTQVDLLGFSMGGYVAQQVTVERPDLVRRLILAGTGSGAAEGAQKGEAEVFKVAFKPVNEPEDFLFLFFDSTETSRAAGEEYLLRLQRRTVSRAPLVKAESVKAQIHAIVAWGTQSAFERLVDLKQPVLVANGKNDIMIPTFNSYLLFQQIPNAELALYPDSGHGFLFQYAEAFSRRISEFLK